MADKIFTEGAWFKRHEKAPDFVVGNISYKVDDFVKFLEANKNESGYVNTSVKKSQKGTYYMELDTWNKEEKSTLTEEDKQALAAIKAQATEPATEGNINPDDIPF